MIAQGMQVTRIRVPHRPATCAESDCPWYLNGHTGQDAGFPFTHPAGVECGDFKRCQPCASPVIVGRQKRLCGACVPCKAGTANCPCASRKHSLPDEFLPLQHTVSTSEGTRIVSGSEWRDRLGEGLHSLHHIKTRGL